MKIAFYKNADGRPLTQRLFHWAVCFVTRSKYSHAELVINGRAYSASERDNGVRDKVIAFDPARWDLVEVVGDAHTALQYYNSRVGNKYDMTGVLSFVLPFLRSDENKDYCFELVGRMLGIMDDKLSATKLLKILDSQNRLVR